MTVLIERPIPFGIVWVVRLLLVVAHRGTLGASASTLRLQDDSASIVSGCSNLTYDAAVIPGHHYWAELRNAYVAAVGTEAATFPWPEEPRAAVSSGLVSGLTEIQYTTEKGRGVFATQFLPAGTLVWDPRYHAQFATEGSLRRFLLSIRPEQACNALQWCYAMVVDNDNSTSIADGTIGVACDLDEGSLFNHAVEGIANVADTEGGVTTLRDISPGEELTQDYLDFEEDLEWFEDLMYIAWGEFGAWDTDDEAVSHASIVVLATAS